MEKEFTKHFIAHCLEKYSNLYKGTKIEKQASVEKTIL